MSRARCPEREALAVPPPLLLEVLGWLPVNTLAKEFAVGNISATAQKGEDVANGLALHIERLADITAHGKRGMNAFSAVKRFRRPAFPKRHGFRE